MRDHLIDSIRGIVFLLMLVHHYYYFHPNHGTVPDFAQTSGTISRTIFIILVGVTMKLFTSNKKKEKKKVNTKKYEILMGALGVTLATYLFLPKKNIIFFGILHFITTAIFLMEDVADDTSLSVLIGILAYIISTKVINKYNVSDNPINMILGSYSRTRSPIDMFPLLNWLPYISFGILLGDIMIKHKLTNLLPENKITMPLEYIGRNTLLYYMVHVIPSIYWMSSKLQ
jgi:uncharacterized membrane protein